MKRYYKYKHTFEKFGLWINFNLEIDRKWEKVRNNIQAKIQRPYEKHEFIYLGNQLFDKVIQTELGFIFETSASFLLRKINQIIEINLIELNNKTDLQIEIHFDSKEYLEIIISFIFLALFTFVSLIIIPFEIYDCNVTYKSFNRSTLFFLLIGVITFGLIWGSKALKIRKTKESLIKFLNDSNI
ncbi:hypothetical protein [Leptospira kmetyi]|uniref:hypothetical protein n=1 Tax=Leptospira kmetyi TaxID=408139 RepID=UPI003EB6ECC1